MLLEARERERQQPELYQAQEAGLPPALPAFEVPPPYYPEEHHHNEFDWLVAHGKFPVLK